MQQNMTMEQWPVCDIIIGSKHTALCSNYTV